MSLKNTHDQELYISVLADGKFHLTSEEGAVDAQGQKATLREYETSKGEKKSKWELTYQSLEGFIQAISFFEGEFGKILNLEIRDDEVYTVSLNTASSFGEDVMKKLPNVDFKKRVTLKPYAFEDDNGKNRKGITIYQEGDKINGYFYDGTNTINGAPTPENGGEGFDTDDWKMFYMTQRKFLIAFTEETTIPRLEKEKENQEDEKGAVNTNDIAF